MCVHCRIFDLYRNLLSKLCQYYRFGAIANFSFALHFMHSSLRLAIHSKIYGIHWYYWQPLAVILSQTRTRIILFMRLNACGQHRSNLTQSLLPQTTKYWFQLRIWSKVVMKSRKSSGNNCTSSNKEWKLDGDNGPRFSVILHS